MRQSRLFTRTRKENPADEVSKNAQLLIRAGFVYKEMAGVYAFLPLGLRVFNKIIGIIREEMNAIGGQEIIMTALQRKELWERTARWDDQVVDTWFKTKLKDGSEIGLGFTHEEPIANMLEQFVASYKDLPFATYQFQTKFRNETRAKSGIMRTREFIMKDLYSFSKNQTEHDVFYKDVTDAYIRIFNRVGIGAQTYITRASGGSFSQFSHEFQTICDAGEDTIYISESDENFKIAVNEEIVNESEAFKDLPFIQSSAKKVKATEVGNIFTLGTRFSHPDLSYTDEHAEKKDVFMGSYGIGPARLMGTVVEVLSDEKGIVWPEAIAPFKVHLVQLGDMGPQATELYDALTKKGIEVFFDDRTGVMAGEKFADADLLGMPYRVVVSEKSMKNGGYELKARTSTESEIVDLDTLITRLS